MLISISSANAEERVNLICDAYASINLDTNEVTRVSGTEGITIFPESKKYSFKGTSGPYREDGNIIRWAIGLGAGIVDKYSLDRVSGEFTDFFGRMIDGKFNAGLVQKYNCKKTIYIPPNAHVSDTGWTCNKGYTKSGNYCFKEKQIIRYVSKLPDCKSSSTYRHNCFGTHTYPDGGVYIGEFLNDIRNGEGTFYYPNGDKYDGKWKNDLEHGNGIYYPRRGRWRRIFSGFWRDGKLEAVNNN